jgi:ABC-2 type transport system permease protein
MKTGVIFRRTLIDSRKAILGWGILCAMLGLWVGVFYPAVDDVLASMSTLLENPLIKGLVGNISDFATPAGWVGTKFLIMMPMLMAIYSVLFNNNATAGEEDRGTIDLVLTTPTPRWRLIVEKAAAFTVASALILTQASLGLMAAILITPELTIPVGIVFPAFMNVLPMMLLLGAVALLLGTIVRSRQTAMGLAAAYIVGSYFVDTLSSLTEGGLLGVLKYFSPFHYFSGPVALHDGLHVVMFVVFTAIALVLLIFSLYFFQRRDLVGA